MSVVWYSTWLLGGFWPGRLRGWPRRVCGREDPFGGKGPVVEGLMALGQDVWITKAGAREVISGKAFGQ